MVQRSMVMNGDVIAIISLNSPPQRPSRLEEMFQLVWSSVDEIDESEDSSGQRLCFKVFFLENSQR